MISIHMQVKLNLNCTETHAMWLLLYNEEGKIIQRWQWVGHSITLEQSSDFSLPLSSDFSTSPAVIHVLNRRGQNVLFYIFTSDSIYSSTNINKQTSNMDLNSSPNYSSLPEAVNIFRQSILKQPIVFKSYSPSNQSGASNSSPN